MTIDELIAALESAEGPSRELDAAIHSALGFNTFFQKYTASIDAAVALIERVLPGWRFAVCTYAGLKPQAHHNSSSSVWTTMDDAQDAAAATPAIAICVALLRAVKEKEG